MKLTNLKKHLQFLILWNLIASFAAFSQEYYDEIHDQNGNVKPQYQKIMQTYLTLSKTKLEELSRQTKKDLSGDNQINLLPRILMESEYELIKAGVKQRAKALKAFLEDHYSGKREYIKAGLIPEPVISEIIKRHGNEDWQNYLKNHKFNFFYGPDIVRIKNGDFAVLEDNIGLLGGYGDLYHARKSLVKQVPGYESQIDLQEPLKYYEDRINYYRKRSKPKGGIIVSLQARDPFDHEENRLKEIYKSLDVEVVEVDEEYFQHGNLKTDLEITKDGVELVKTTKNGIVVRKQVGFIIANTSFYSIDSSHPAAKKGLLIEEANTALDNYNGTKKKSRGYSLKKLGDEYFADRLMKQAEKIQTLITDYQGGQEINYSRLEEILKGVTRSKAHARNGRSGIKGLIQSFLDGKVGMNYSPGTDFIEDKEFYMYVDKIISFYLDEKPILKNLKTRSFRKFDLNGNAFIDRDLMHETISNLNQNVFKGVDGMGGNMVWIGPKLNKADSKVIKDRVEKQYSKMIVQEYHHPSVHNGRIVDMRDYADVGAETGDIFISPILWGRDTLLSGNGKVNIGDNGNETVILRQKSWIQKCKQSLRAGP